MAPEHIAERVLLEHTGAAGTCLALDIGYSSLRAFILLTGHDEMMRYTISEISEIYKLFLYFFIFFFLLFFFYFFFVGGDRIRVHHPLMIMYSFTFSFSAFSSSSTSIVLGAST